MAAKFKLTADLYVSAIAAYKIDKTIIGVREAIKCSHYVAKELIYNGYRGFDSIEFAIEQENRNASQEKRTNNKKDIKEFDSESALTLTVVIFNQTQRKHVKSNGEGISMREIKDMLAVGDVLEERTKQIGQEILALPMAGLTEKQLDQMLKGKIKPR